jgi:hypothetical protein
VILTNSDAFAIFLHLSDETLYLMLRTCHVTGDNVKEFKWWEVILVRS